LPPEKNSKDQLVQKSQSKSRTVTSFDNAQVLAMTVIEMSYEFLGLLQSKFAQSERKISFSWWSPV